jgi:hypothetical protein
LYREHLERAGHEVYWVSPNRRWSRWLYGHGTAPERVLDITDHGPEWKRTGATAEDRAELAVLERANGWNIYDLIQMDELLRRRPTDYAVRYLAVCARQVGDFLRRYQIGMVFAEQTWAFELLTGQVCGDLGIPFLRPVSVRIPNERFAFFAHRRETDMVVFGTATDEHRRQARELLREYRSRPAPPAYATLNWSILRFNWGWTRNLIKHVADVAGDPFDETTLRPLGLVGKYLGKMIRVRRNRLLGPFREVKLPPGQPFVLFPLHLEPESTINVMGSPLCNQVELARALARTLPVTHELWVKEHRIALPNRSARDYRELASIPGVRLIDPFVSSLALIPHADLVVAVTGTACYEAALLGRPQLFTDCRSRVVPIHHGLKISTQMRPTPLVPSLGQVAV